VTNAKFLIKPPVASLARLAVVFAVPIRLKIVTELYMRPMSPKQFFNVFGGGSISRVDRHFKRLTEHGWLRLLYTEKGDGRRGGTEHVYRATELAIFDLDTWSQLPYSIRADYSSRAFRQLTERAEKAMTAGTFDARPERHLTWTALALDQLGWERIITAADSLFESLLEEQTDAKLRIAASDEETILATVALMAFESPGADNLESRSGLVLPVVEADHCFDSAEANMLRLSKIFADPLKLKIVTELNLREMSPSQFHSEFGGGPLSALDHRFKYLVKLGSLVEVKTKTGGTRRGATEHFYRATGPAIFDIHSWSEVPGSLKTRYSWNTFEQLVEQVAKAMVAGTFDARPERHLTWSLLRLDQRSWEQVIAATDANFAFLVEEEAAAARRIEESGEKPIRATVATAAFESPKEALEAP
jgi:DNA-binding transcriptional ArsR family regulator